MQKCCIKFSSFTWGNTVFNDGMKKATIKYWNIAAKIYGIIYNMSNLMLNTFEFK